tara:strand:+ start:554 stop:1702 length:1149 start_codon:yes stop_codon:yes gene_type:complete
MANVTRYQDIKDAESTDYDDVALGEIMLRFDPRDIPITRARDNIRTFQGGGETNVAYGLAQTFGMDTSVLTALVDDPIGRNIEHQLKEGSVDTSNILWWNTSNDGGPHSTDAKGTIANGINITYAGSGVLGSETMYYRANSAASKLKPGDFDFKELFGERGVRVFSTGGIMTLIGTETADLAIEAAQAAAEYGTFVAADLNYRSKVQPDKEVARAINRTLAPHLGMLVGNHSDFDDAFGYSNDIPENASFAEWKAGWEKIAQQVAKDFPNLTLIGSQWRGAHDADQISWAAALYDVETGKLYESPVRENYHIRDRTGGGDSFAAGVIAATLKGQDLQTAVDWGSAHGLLVQETPGDTSMVTQKEVEAEVKRAYQKGGVNASR